MARKEDVLVSPEKISTKRQKKFAQLPPASAPREETNAQWLALLGHGIKSPVARILALSEFMLKEIPGELNSEQKEYLQDIYHNSYLLTNYINSLLTLSKVESGYMKLNIGAYDFREIVESVVTKVDTMAASRNSQIIVKIPNDLSPVCCDRNKIEQILFNLLDNAIKFTREGTITVSVIEDHAGELLRVAVRDTGIGISEKLRPKVFDTFFTEKSALNPGGSGLGLAVVKEFVYLHGGQVVLESCPGRGTRVEFTIPNSLSEKGLSHAGSCK